jgi:hypothetical protein
VNWNFSGSVGWIDLRLSLVDSPAKPASAFGVTLYLTPQGFSASPQCLARSPPVA